MAQPQMTPEQQEDLQRYQQLAQQLDVIGRQIQQLELEKRDLEIAKKETKDLDNSAVIYRSAGRLLFQTNLEDVNKYVEEEHEKVEVRIASLTKRQNKLVASFKELQERLSGSQ
ncbi:MAG: prefoldin subunit [Candidatus Heimdallarchaeota archaeon]|nr:prefoldin subunit [Candidatus Heimdallarchaeota archaeon]MCK5409332.1 prefoldin subunit [Candidatus Heimdallarchaeota archaeon]